MYVHFPWCARKCPYCDFNSRAGRPDPVYFETVKAEIRARAPDFHGVPFSSIYFGGGTPSLADPGQIASVIETARGALEFSDPPETTIEVNPGTVEETRFSAFVRAAVNRVSIGVQSFDPDVLRGLDRIHGPDDALAAIAAARAAGMARVGVDLIFGAPHQSATSFLRSVEIAADSGADHLSLYALTIHPDTPFGRVDPETLDLPPDDDVAGMYESAREFLAGHGWDHYEISNWALPGAECAHNLNTWAGGFYLGAGAGAHGHMPKGNLGFGISDSGFQDTRRTRYGNIEDSATYMAAVGRGDLPESFSEDVDGGARARELIYTGLRMMRGIDLDLLAVETPAGTVERIERSVPALEDEGLVRLDRRNLALTGRGELFADNVALRLI